MTDNHLRDRVLHATEDFQSTRDAVFELLLRHPFRVCATILDKSELANGYTTDVGCYTEAWNWHLSQLGPQEGPMLVTAATLFTGGKYRGLKGVRAAMVVAVDIHLVTPERALSIIPGHADPNLQVADYCCWAIQRKYARRDLRSYALIEDRIASEVLWSS